MQYSELMKMDVRELAERGALLVAENLKIKTAIQQKIMIEELMSGKHQKVYIFDSAKKADKMIGEKWDEVGSELAAEILREMLDYFETPEYRNCLTGKNN